jgi:anti-sigma factor RsiW
MTSECRETLLGISAYLDGELEAAACATIERHCAACATCASLVENLKQTAGLCRQLGTAPLPSPILERARASVRRLLEDRTANGG